MAGNYVEEVSAIPILGMELRFRDIQRNGREKNVQDQWRSSDTLIKDVSVERIKHQQIVNAFFTW